jgi:eukaryotic-like serine/threonine-protein kinase
MNAATQREEGIFDTARNLADPAAREAFLNRVCVGDSALRARLDRLLEAASEADRFFAEGGTALSVGGTPIHTTSSATGSGAPPSSSLPGEEKIGTRIGRYKLLKKIGEGGCGVVYLAEQEEPVRRRVALKIIKLGMETKSVIARFEAERQALAMMDHPNIARVFDAGATDRGSPYFVMELVSGVKITDYCDQNRLDTRRRLDLFIQICHAIQHAHQKGVIHRDIKPSNIIVTLHDAAPVPKVIDFGIAKATETQLTDKILHTANAQFIGTPAYMSPEQAELGRLDIDTRSDIYGLGVLLYELLTGRTPFDAKALLEAGLDEMRRTLRETEPPRPSRRLHALPHPTPRPSPDSARPRRPSSYRCSAAISIGLP